MAGTPEKVTINGLRISKDVAIRSGLIPNPEPAQREVQVEGVQPSESVIVNGLKISREVAERNNLIPGFTRNRTVEVRQPSGSPINKEMGTGAGAAGGGGKPPEDPHPPVGGEATTPAEPPRRRRPEEPINPEMETDGQTDNGNRRKLKQYIESGASRRYRDAVSNREFGLEDSEDKREAKRTELEQKVGIEGILPQDLSLLGKDPWDILWSLYDRGRAELKSLNIKNVSMDVIRQHSKEIVDKYLNIDPNRLTEALHSQQTAVIAALSLSLAFYKLSHPREEMGQLYVNTGITNAEHFLAEKQHEGIKLTPDEQILRSWLVVLRNIATLYDRSIKPYKDGSMKKLELLQGAQDRLLPKDVLRTLFTSRKVQEATHRAKLADRPDYWDISGEGGEGGAFRNDLLKIVGEYLNIETYKCVKTVKTCSTFLYPIYEAWQGLQRFWRYKRMFSGAELLIDTSEQGEVTWGTKQVRVYQDSQTGVVLPMHLNEQTGEYELNPLPPNVNRESLITRDVAYPVPITVDGGRLHMDIIHDFFRYPDGHNVDTFYKLATVSMVSLRNAIRETESGSEVFINETNSWIGDFNLAWLLSRTGISKKLFREIDPNIDGIDFESFTTIKDGSARRRYLDTFCQSLLPVNLPARERARREAILKRVVKVNMGRLRTVWFNKEAVSEQDITDVSQARVPVLQPGLDLDETWIDNRGRIRRCFDFDKLGALAYSSSEKGTELTTVTQYLRYWTEQEKPLIDDIIKNIEPQQYADMLKRLEALDSRGQLKFLVTVPEVSDHIIGQIAEKVVDRFIVQPAELVRLQGQKLQFMDALYPMRHKLELDLNADLHFAAAGLVGSYSKETMDLPTARQRLIDGMVAAQRERLGRELTPVEMRTIEMEMLFRGLLRRGMNENLHVDAWNVYARKQLTTSFEVAGFTREQILGILGQEDERNLKPLEILFTIVGIKADFSKDIVPRDNFLRVSPTDEIQRKDRYLRKYTEMTEKERNEKLAQLLGVNQENNQRVTAGLNHLMQETLNYRKRQGDHETVSNLLYSYDFLDIIHWVSKEVLLPYAYEYEFCWKKTRTLDDNFKALQAKIASETQRPSGWTWSRGREYYWIDQGGIKSVNLHAIRWVIDSMLSGQVVPFGRYQGQSLYNQYETRELNQNGTRNPNYNQLITNAQGQREYGVSRVRSDCIGWGTRKLEADWTEGFPINNPDLAVIWFLGYLSIHKQHVLSAELADAEYAKRHHKQLEQVNNQDRKSWDYLELYNHQLVLWSLIAVGPDNLENILSGLTQFASKGVDPNLEYDPEPYERFASMLGVLRTDKKAVEKLRQYRYQLLERLGWKEVINPSPTPDGAMAIKWADEARQKEAKMRQSGALGTLEMFTFKGADELLKTFGRLDLMGEIGSTKHRFRNLIRAGAYPIVGGSGLALATNTILKAAVGVAPGAVALWYLATAVPGIASWFMGMDVKPEDLYMYSGFGPANLVNVKGTLGFQNLMIRAFSRNGLRFLVSHNRRLLRSEALRGEPANASQGKVLTTGPFASLIGAKFVEQLILIPRTRYLRGGMKAAS